MTNPFHEAIARAINETITKALGWDTAAIVRVFYNMDANIARAFKEIINRALDEDSDNPAAHQFIDELWGTKALAHVLDDRESRREYDRGNFLRAVNLAFGFAETCPHDEDDDDYE